MSGQHAVELAPLMATVLMACALAQPACRCLHRATVLAAAQALALAGIAFAQAVAQGSLLLALAGVVTLVLQGVALPVLLPRLARRGQRIDSSLGSVPGVAAGLGLVGVAMLAAPATIAPAVGLVLLGLLLLLTRRDRFGQALGALPLANGVLLLALLGGRPGLAMVLSLAVLVPPALALATGLQPLWRASTP